MKPASLLSIAIDAARYGDPLEPKSANLSVTQDFITKLQDVQRYVKDKGVDHLALEGEPDAWLPQGIDTQLRFGAGELVVSSTAFWFRSKSGPLQRQFETVPTCIDSLMAEVARVGVRRRAIVAA